MATMQALTFYGPRDVRVEEVPRPEIEEPGDVLLRIDRAAICGTDLHPYHGRMEIEEGFVLGHEYLGTIEAKGDGVTQFEEGDRAVGSFFVALREVLVLPPRPADEVHGDPRVRARLWRSATFRARSPQYMRVPEADLTLRKIPARTGSATRTCCSSATSSRPATTPCARRTCGPATWSRSSDAARSGSAR